MSVVEPVGSETSAAPSALPWRGPFWKGHGTENDFVLVLDEDGTRDLAPAEVRALCDRRSGIGGDGLELIKHHKRLRDAEARRWARDWLGDIQHLPAPSTTLAPRTVDRKTSVAEIVASSKGIKASPAEAYLRKRGITAIPPAVIRFRRLAAGQYGALVALATDSR